MRCVLWRQHRGQLVWTAAILLLASVSMLLVAHSADQWLVRYEHWLAQMRAAGCPLPFQRSGVVHVPSAAACHSLLAHYPAGPQEAFTRSYNFAIPVFEEGLVLVLVVVAVLVGAPVVAREIEQRTQLVAWTQSVSRGRWFATKTAVLGTGLAAAGLVAGIANDRVQIPLTRGGLTSSRWPWFFSIDVTPAAETLLAFALAVAIGAYLRRTLAAVGAALVAFLVLFVMTAWGVRSLTPVSRANGPRGLPHDVWVLGGGQYHPASQYWPLQVTYVAMLLVLSVVLLALGWRATRPRNVV